jgi:O-antigen ligase
MMSTNVHALDIAMTAPTSVAHKIALAFVWLAIASGAIVFTEPAPFDVFGAGLLILLPALGLLRLTPGLTLYFAVTLVPVGCAFFAILAAIDPSKSLTHTAVTLFLTMVSLLLAAFVAKAPYRHTRLICNGAVAAGVIAASAGFAGYLDLFPGAYDIFTLYGRVSGTFKDPNVFGASLVLPSVYLMHILLSAAGRGRKILAAVGLMLLVLGVLLSFSRGAWFGLAVAAAIFAYFAFVTATSDTQRIRIMGGVVGAAGVGALLVLVALQFDVVANLLTERATLTQSYDEGPEGRFGGQVKAKRLILSHPFGLGAQQFDGFYHLEEAHNVYLSMFMNAGWLGGLLFAMIVAATVVLGARHALRTSETQRLYMVVYAAFVAHACEGFVIDLDHWRHFHLLLALNWGLMLSDRVPMLTRSLALGVPKRPARLLPSTPSANLRPAYMAS